MKKLTITTDTENQAKFLATFLKNLQMVRSVDISSEESSDEEYNWTNPSRPATDEEFEQMIAEAEQQTGVPAETARKQTMELIEKWMTEQK